MLNPFLPKKRLPQRQPVVNNPQIPNAPFLVQDPPKKQPVSPAQALLNPIGTSATSGNGGGGTQAGGTGPGGSSVNIGNNDPNAANGAIGGGFQLPPGATNTGYMDPAVAAALKQLLGQSGGDVAGQQALARDESQRATGQALADSRARAGFGGFALSGAAQGQDAAIRSQAANDLLKNQFAIQQQGRDNQFRNTGLVSDAFNQESNRGFGAEQNAADRSVQMAAIQAAIDALNQNPTNPAAGSGGSAPAGPPLPPGATHPYSGPNDTKLHAAVGTVEGNWTLVTYANGMPVWESNDAKRTHYNGQHPPQVGSVSETIPTVKPPGT